jgi:putative ABC transport system substrate-binding protein
MTRRITRREFGQNLAALIALLGPVRVAGTAAARETGRPSRVGVLLVGPSLESNEVHVFKQALREAGYIEGSNIAIEWRHADGDYDKAKRLAVELVQAHVDAIVSDGTIGTHAAKRATSTIPIVMCLVSDPVGAGLVDNLAHPGGNVTGLTIITNELSAKQLQLLTDAIPRAERVAVLWNPATPYHPKAVEDLKAAAPSLGLKLSFLAVRAPKDLDTAISTAIRAQTEAVYVIGDPLFYAHRTVLLTGALKARLPVITGFRGYVSDGALLSYGPNLDHVFRRAAEYVAKILKGTKPGDLPVERPTKFELVINLKTAKALGIEVPQSLLLRADEVIQ